MESSTKTKSKNQPPPELPQSPLTKKSFKNSFINLLRYKPRQSSSPQSTHKSFLLRKFENFRQTHQHSTPPKTEQFLAATNSSSSSDKTTPHCQLNNPVQHIAIVTSTNKLHNNHISLPATSSDIASQSTSSAAHTAQERDSKAYNTTHNETLLLLSPDVLNKHNLSQTNSLASSSSLSPNTIALPQYYTLSSLSEFKKHKKICKNLSLEINANTSYQCSPTSKRICDGYYTKKPHTITDIKQLLDEEANIRNKSASM